MSEAALLSMALSIQNRLQMPTNRQIVSVKKNTGQWNPPFTPVNITGRGIVFAFDVRLPSVWTDPNYITVIIDGTQYVLGQNIIAARHGNSEGYWIHGHPIPFNSQFRIDVGGPSNSNEWGYFVVHYGLF